jgi:chromosome segregation ATPase
MEEAAAEATEKAYCDSEMAKTEEKKSELEDDIAKITAKIDKLTALSTELKAEVKELQAELAALAREQAKMDKIRGEQKEAYLAAKAELEVLLGVDVGSVLLRAELVHLRLLLRERRELRLQLLHLLLELRGRSHAYNTQFPSQVVYKGFIFPNSRNCDSAYAAPHLCAVWCVAIL